MIVMVNLFGAVALLLFGLGQVKDGVMRAFGAKLKMQLASGTRSYIRSFVSGFVATTILQSSTATALMVSSFIERRLVEPRMGQIVLLGANVGTAVTAWLLAAGVDWISPLIILGGAFLCRGVSENRKGVGSALIGVGLILLSLHLLATSTQPMRQSSTLIAFVNLLDSAWPLALVVSATIAFVSASSIAAIMLILSLSSSGTLSANLSILLVMGANLGAAILPVILMSGGTPSARRVVLGNLLVRAVGCALALPLVGYGAQLLYVLPIPPARYPIEVHLGLNLAFAALAWPFAPLLTFFMVRLVPDDAQQENAPKYLDQGGLSTPLVALANATRETLGIGDLIQQMLEHLREAFKNDDPVLLREIAPLEDRVDNLQLAVKTYLSELGRTGLDAENGQRSLAIIDYAINLEHIGDIIEKVLLPQISRKVTMKLRFRDDDYLDIRTLMDLTIDNLAIAQTTFVTRDFDFARKMMTRKVEIQALERQSGARQIERLRDGGSDCLPTSSLHLDILRDLRRINSHIASVAHPIIQQYDAAIKIAPVAPPRKRAPA